MSLLALRLAWLGAYLHFTFRWPWVCSWLSPNRQSGFRSGNPRLRKKFPRRPGFFARLCSERMRDAAREKSPFRQLEFCFETPVVRPLPSAVALQERAVSLLLSLGAENLAARLRVGWNDRMRTTVGRADFQRCHIWLNPA